ncbi:MAG: hypothetical protein LBB91_04200 [Clostridiales bacterium]|jgi:hypothetical protein|nr:hypothetical protein [Clostridiales bacterium]
MILYLSRNESADLLDKTANDKSLHIHKMSGNFSLSEFIIIEMRKFANCRYFCIERFAISENDCEFFEALRSFQMMYNARVIIIYESEDEIDSFTRKLVKIGVTNIVTASSTEEKLGQIAECLSSKGMLKYKPDEAIARERGNKAGEEKETLVQNIIHREIQDEQYRFDCVNITIGIIGSTRRVGTTTLALGLANFIKNHGGTACYVALNTNQHLCSIANEYNFDTEEDYYTHNNVDFYESMLPKHDYNFIIMDFGDAKRDTVRKYRESNVHLLCGASDKQFEVIEFAEALKQVKSVKPQILTYGPNSECNELFRTTVTNEPIIIKPVGSMLDFNVNGIVFKGILQLYIVETSKRL